MKKALLLDWIGVLVKEKEGNKNRRNELYTRLLKKETSKEEVEELVESFEKYNKLWSIIPDLSKHYRICVVNNGPKETMEFWDKHFNYSKYMKFVNSEVIGIEKPDPEIYQIACKEINVNTHEVIYMDDHSGFPKETIDLGMKFIHWTSFEKGFKEFLDYIKEQDGLDFTRIS